MSGHGSTGAPWNGPSARCTHVPPDPALPRAAACEECGSRINLRSCATCGHVGCCESQLGHNRSHAFAADHPVIYSMPIGPDSFTWCYAEDRYLR